MAKFSNYQKQSSTETTHLGTFMHTAGDLVVIKLETKDIPYPNSPVLLNKKQIGKIDEIFGPIDDVYASIKVESSEKIGENCKFEAFKDKFILKSRFLPREEVEKNKERKDKGNSKGRNDKGNKFNKERSNNERGDRKGFNDRKSFNNDKRSFNNDKKDFNNDRKSFNNNKRGFNNDRNSNMKFNNKKKPFS